MSKKIIYLLSLLMALSIAFTNCKKITATGGAGGDGHIPKTTIEIQDKYIVVNFEESALTDRKIEFRAIGTETDISANAGKDIVIQITSPSQKISVNPGSGYNIQIADITSETKKILYETNNITTYLFYEEFNQNEALPANSEQANNLEPWKGKWLAAWKGASAWNHAMNGSFRNLELKKEGDTEYLHLKATKTGDDDSSSIGSGIQTTHLYGQNEAPSSDKRREPFFFTYGKVEFRVRIKNQAGNPTKGPFPALWLMPARGNGTKNPKWKDWAAGGEIDIMEYVYKNPEKVDQTIHTGYYGTDGKDYSFSPGSQAIANVDNWHIYTLEWTKKGLYWYIDGVLGRGPYLRTDDIQKYPFVDESAFYIIMNVGLGRAKDNYPGGAQKGLDTWMDVDWVKVSPNKDTILDNSRGVNGCEYYKDVQWK